MALRLLGEVPLEALTTRVVASEVGVSQPALFRHFRSRDELLVAVVERARAEMGGLADRVLREEQPLRALESLVRGLFAFAREHPGLPRLLFFDVSAREEAPYHAPLRLMVSMQSKLVAELVRKAQADRVIDAGCDPERAAFLLTALLQGVLAQWQHGGRERDLSADAEDLFELWSSAVAQGRPARRGALRPEAGRERRPLARLDARPLLESGEDPLDAILSALDDVEPGGALELLVPFRPRPLLTFLESRGHGLTDERLDEELFRVTIRKDDPRSLLDLREHEAPVPMERVLVAVTELGAGDNLLARLPRVPRLLFPRLEERGLTHAVQESVDGTALLLVRRSDG